jgi:hypothetical protein
MSLRTPNLHQAFLEPFGARAHVRGEVRDKPLLVDLDLPLPPRLRIYMYNLVGGVGTKRDDEYKAVLRLRGQAVGSYESFDHSDGRVTLLVAYQADFDVFVMWDASLHPRFKNGGNIQVHSHTVLTAAAVGYAEQTRRLVVAGANEIVLACQKWNLPATVERRVALTGGL